MPTHRKSHLREQVLAFVRFADPTDVQYIFPPTLSVQEQTYVHKLATAHGLCAQSFGEKTRRYVSIHRVASVSTSDIAVFPPSTEDPAEVVSIEVRLNMESRDRLVNSFCTTAHVDWDTGCSTCTLYVGLGDRSQDGPYMRGDICQILAEHVREGREVKMQCVNLCEVASMWAVGVILPDYAPSTYRTPHIIISRSQKSNKHQLLEGWWRPLSPESHQVVAGQVTYFCHENLDSAPRDRSHVMSTSNTLRDTAFFTQACRNCAYRYTGHVSGHCCLGCRRKPGNHDKKCARLSFPSRATQSWAYDVPGQNSKTQARTCETCSAVVTGMLYGACCDKCAAITGQQNTQCEQQAGVVSEPNGGEHAIVAPLSQSASRQEEKKEEGKHTCVTWDGGVTEMLDSLCCEYCATGAGKRDARCECSADAFSVSDPNREEHVIVVPVSHGEAQQDGKKEEREKEPKRKHTCVTRESVKTDGFYCSACTDRPCMRSSAWEHATLVSGEHQACMELKQCEHCDFAQTGIISGYCCNACVQQTNSHDSYCERKQCLSLNDSTLQHQEQKPQLVRQQEEQRMQLQLQRQQEQQLHVQLQLQLQVQARLQQLQPWVVRREKCQSCVFLQTGRVSGFCCRTCRKTGGRDHGRKCMRVPYIPDRRASSRSSSSRSCSRTFDNECGDDKRTSWLTKGYKDASASAMKVVAASSSSSIQRSTSSLTRIAHSPTTTHTHKTLHTFMSASSPLQETMEDEKKETEKGTHKEKDKDKDKDEEKADVKDKEGDKGKEKDKEVESPAEERENEEEKKDRQKLEVKGEERRVEEKEEEKVKVNEMVKAKEIEKEKEEERQEDRAVSEKNTKTWRAMTCPHCHYAQSDAAQDYCCWKCAKWPGTHSHWCEQRMSCSIKLLTAQQQRICVPALAIARMRKLGWWADIAVTSPKTAAVRSMSRIAVGKKWRRRNPAEEQLRWRRAWRGYLQRSRKKATPRNAIAAKATRGSTARWSVNADVLLGAEMTRSQRTKVAAK